MMNSDLVNAARAPETYEQFGCAINAISATELFAKYGAAGFLYDEKRKKLAPFWDRIRDNWERALTLGENLVYFLTYEDPDAGVWASVGSWRTTLHGWNSQHVVSMGGPVGSRSVLLACAALRGRNRYANTDQFQQNWFRPSNRFANRVFGSIVAALGEGSAWVQSHTYFAVPPFMLSADTSDNVEWATNDNDDWRVFLARARGRVFLACDELNDPDIELDALDAIYRCAGLRRFRRIAVARTEGGVQGVAIAYRGPLGLNFSFLENRCDLILSPMLDGDVATATAMALLHRVAPHYAEFEPGFIPVVSDATTAMLLIARGAQLIRMYSQSMWLGTDCYVGWYRHVSGFYKRLTERDRWHGIGGKEAAL